MQHITDLEKQTDQLYELFEKISERNVFLFLGAGSSVTKDKSFLSSTLIEFFQDKKHIDFTITQFYSPTKLTRCRATEGECSQYNPPISL